MFLQIWLLSGVCVKCRTMLLHKMQQEQLKSQLKSPKSQMQDFLVIIPKK